MRLVLVRHGETAWNKEGRFQGQSLVGLNSKGLMQARQIAKAIVPMKPAALYASPLTRTLMTAEEISKLISIPVVPVEGIKEINLGELEGITGQRMRQEYSQIYSAWRADPSEVTFPGGESMRCLQKRAWNAISEIQKAHPKDLVVVVSHNFAIRSILCRFLGLPFSRFHRLRVDLASINVLQANGSYRQVLSINDKCHLVEDEDLQQD